MVINETIRAKWYGKSRLPVKWICVHYTANSGKTATARGNALYFQRGERVASADYVVDENSIYRTVPEGCYSYAVGDNQRYLNGGGSLKGVVTNLNSISVEMVSHSDKNGYYIPEKTLQNTIWLIKRLQKQYGVPENHIIRHYDVTGKMCPMTHCKTEQGEKLWKDFKCRLREEEPMTAEERKEFEALKKEVAKLKSPMIYNYIDENLPGWCTPYVKKAVEIGLVKGDENGLGLTDEKIWMLVVIMRAMGIME